MVAVARVDKHSRVELEGDAKAPQEVQAEQPVSRQERGQVVDAHCQARYGAAAYPQPVQPDDRHRRALADADQCLHAYGRPEVEALGRGTRDGGLLCADVGNHVGVKLLVEDSPNSDQAVSRQERHAVGAWHQRTILTPSGICSPPVKNS